MFGKTKAFTLIELLIVIAVISILIGIALPRFKGMQLEGNIAKAKGELRTLQTAVESYYIHNGSYPANFPSDLETANPNIIGSDAPTDPFMSGNDYGFAISGNGNYYVIYSAGPDGRRTVRGINNSGDVTGTVNDDIFVSNGNTPASS